jgi:hypothetical protein
LFFFSFPFFLLSYFSFLFPFLNRYRRGRAAAAPVHGGVALMTRGNAGSGCTGRGIGPRLYGVKWLAVAPGQ